MTEIIPEYPSSSWYFENWQKYKANHPNEKEYIENAERINKTHWKKVTRTVTT